MASKPRFKIGDQVNVIILGQVQNIEPGFIVTVFDPYDDVYGYEVQFPDGTLLQYEEKNLEFATQNEDVEDINHFRQRGYYLHELTPLARRILLDSPHDHDGHAKCVLALYPNEFVFNDSHRWLAYNGRYWKREGAERAVERAITNTLQLRQQIGIAEKNEDLVKKSWAYRRDVVGIREQLKKELAISIEMDEFDCDYDALNVRNGVIDLRTGVLTSHSPLKRFTYCIPIDYDPDADQTLWLKFLHEAVENPIMVDFLQMAIGYSLTGRTSEECLFYVYGPLRSGKGTLTETLIKLLGKPLAIEGDFETFTATRTGDTQNFDLAPLKPCRFVAASESNRYGSLNPAKIKQLTGGNYIRCAFKHQDHFSYRPQYKIWLSSNHKVNVDVDDDAAWARVHVINFPNSHFGKEDKGLKTRLLSEQNLRGVLAWAIEGAKKWYASPNGLVAPMEVKTATQDHRSELDYIQMYLEDRCTIEPGNKDLYVASSALYSDYKFWCENEGHKPKYQRQFTISLTSKGFTTGKEYIGAKQARVIYGLKLLP